MQDFRNEINKLRERAKIKKDDLETSQDNKQARRQKLSTISILASTGAGFTLLLNLIILTASPNPDQLSVISQLISACLSGISVGTAVWVIFLDHALDQSGKALSKCERVRYDINIGYEHARDLLSEVQDITGKYVQGRQSTGGWENPHPRGRDNTGEEPPQQAIPPRPRPPRRP